MTSFTIAAGQQTSTPQTLTGAEIGTIATGGSIGLVSNQYSVVNVIDPNGAVINNAGLLSHGNRESAIYVTANNTNANLTITNSGTISSSLGIPIFIAGDANTLLDNSGNIQSTESAFYSVLFANGDDRLIIRNGSVISTRIEGAGGTDTLDYSFWSGSGVTANLGAQTGTGLTTIMNFENMVGSAQGDLLTGSAGANRIEGGGGNDTLNGGDGNDTLDGGTGNDNLVGEAGDDALIGGAGNNTLDGGTGSDVVYYSVPSTTQALNLVASTTAITGANGAGGTDTLIGIEGIQAGSFNDMINASSYTVGQIYLYGGAGNDSLTGTAFNDYLAGEDGNDTLSGGGGSDILLGGAGNDSMDGGAGIDTASFASAAGAVFYGLLAQGTASNTLGAGTDTLTNFENLTGGAFNDTLGGGNTASVLDGAGGDDTLYGYTGNDTLLGGAGNDVLNGGAGNDSMTGGTGNDTYVVDAAGDVVVELAGEGTDSVFVTADGWTASANLEAIYLYGSATFVTGSAGSDVLVALANTGSTLNGGNGNDTLWGQAGADSLLGGAGDDVIRGGGGNDTLNGGGGNDQLVGGSGADVFQFDVAGWGYDQIFDFVVGTDKINLAGAATSYSQLTVYGASGSTVVVLGTARIDVYGVALTPSDFLFA